MILIPFVIGFEKLLFQKYGFEVMLGFVFYGVFIRCCFGVLDSRLGLFAMC
jgi:hypothetical protein